VIVADAVVLIFVSSSTHPHARTPEDTRIDPQSARVCFTPACAVPRTGTSQMARWNGAGYALGARSTYQERASSASPLRRQWVKNGGLETCTGGEGEGRAASSSSGGGGGGSNYRCLGEENWQEREKQRQRQREREREKHAKRAKEREREEAEKRDKVDRAFRAWLDRKKKEAQAEREAQRRREEALAKLR